MVPVSPGSTRAFACVKQGRGNGGNGVWKVSLLEPDGRPGHDALVRVQHAQTKDAATEDMTLGEFIERLLGLLRMVRLPDRSAVPVTSRRRLDPLLPRPQSRSSGSNTNGPAGFSTLRQSTGSTPRRPIKQMEAADTARYQRLRSKVEQEWVPQMQELLGIDTPDLPVIWDADFLYGPRNDAGDDTYVLCEVNVSAVWPFPPQATRPLAAAAAARSHA